MRLMLSMGINDDDPSIVAALHVIDDCDIASRRRKAHVAHPSFRLVDHISGGKLQMSTYADGLTDHRQ